MKYKNIFIFFYFLTLSAFAQDENVKIYFSEKDIAISDSFAINIEYKTRIKNLGNFPEIPDFVKGSTYFKKENKVFFVQQIYYPTKVGSFVLPDFTILLNDKTIHTTGSSLKVKPGKAIAVSSKKNSEKFEITHPDVLLVCKSNKNEVYTGEPFVLNLSLNISLENTAEINFIDLNSQLTNLRTKLKPANCWMEDFNTSSIDKGENVVIEGKNYISFNLARISLTPLDSSKIVIPRLNLTMLKYKIRKSKNLIERIPEEFELHSKMVNVIVQALPPHPLSNKIPAGIYTLYERLYNEKVNAGEGAKYTLTIIGKNVSRLNPNVTKESNPDIFERKISYRQVISNKEIIGEKTFEYFIMPTEPGEYELSKYFNLIYFNTHKHHYDTLLSKKTITVSGESQRNSDISFDSEDEFYSLVHRLNDSLINRNHDNATKIIINALIIAMLISTVVLILKR